MNKREKHISQYKLAFQSFLKNKMAVFAASLLFIFYFSALFADFLSPYSFENEERNYSYAPPTKIHLIDKDGKLSTPFVYSYTLEFDQFHKRIYKQDTSRKYLVKIFQKGDEYKFLGLIKSDIHLFNVDMPARIYLWGADSRGRDIFTRLLHGGRISLSIGLIGVSISFTLGLLIGGIAGYYGGKVDSVLMRICEMFMMIPGFYLMLALRSAVPDNFNSLQVYLSVVVILSFIGWAGLARIIRGISMSIKSRDFVLAAKAIGLSDLRIIVTHVLPHTLSYSIVAIMLSIPGYILGEAGLSLLGLGIQDPTPSWGNMLSESMAIVHIKFNPWIMLPGFFIFLTVSSFNIIGDALRDCLDPLYRGEK